jgi:hypothetical protein
MNGSGRWHFSALTLDASVDRRLATDAWHHPPSFLSVMRPSKSVLVIAAVLLTAVLAYFGTGLNPFWPLLWFAPVPVLVVATGLRPFHAFLVALLAWLGGELNQWTYFTQVLGIPLPIAILFFLIPAALFGLGVLFTRSFLPPPIANPRDARLSDLLCDLGIS